MAAIAKTSEFRERHLLVIVATVSGENNSVLEIPMKEQISAMSLQAVGTFGGSAQIDLKAGNDGTDAKRAALPTAASLTAEGIKSVAVADLGYRYYYLELSSAHASTDLTLTLVARLRR
jgi:hypothetical protein